MNRHKPQISRWLLLSVCLLLVSVLPSYGQTLTAEDRVKIDQLARTMGAFDRQGQDLLARFGFPPEGEFTERWNDWRALPLNGQIELAWRSAEQAERGSGEAFLKAYASEVASVNSAVHNDSVLRDLVPAQGQPLPKAKRLQFRVPQGEFANIDLPPRVREIVGALAKHASTVPGGPLSVAARCCGVSTEQAMERLARARTYREFLEYVLANGEVPPEMARRLARLTNIVTHANYAVLSAQELQRFRPALEAIAKRPGASTPNDTFAMPVHGDDFDPIDRAVTAELSTIAAERQSRLAGASAYSKLHRWMQHEPLAEELDWGGRRDRLFEASNYGDPGAGGGGGGGGTPPLHAPRTTPTPITQPPAPPRTVPALPARPVAPGRSFSRVISFRGGRGGIVLGSPVRPAPGLHKPVTITWQPLVEAAHAAWLPAQTIGVFVFRLDNNETVVSPPVRADDASAAVRLVLTGIAGTPPAREGEAIGLAGMSRPVTSYQLVDGEVQAVKDAIGFSFYVHPAISRTTLAPVVMLADARPVIEELSSHLKRNVNASPAPAAAKEQLTEWLAMPKGNYKITDVPMEVHEHEGLLSTRRVSPKTADATSSCDCFLSMQTFDEHGEPRLGKDEPVSFYSILPVLLEHLPEFRRLNEFARQTALLRWAAANDAVWLGDIPVKPATRSAATMYVRADGEVEFGMDPDEEAFALAQKVERASHAILDVGKASAALRALDAEVASHRRTALALAAIERVIAVDHMFYLSRDSSVEVTEVQATFSIGWMDPITADDDSFAHFQKWMDMDAASLARISQARELYRSIAAQVEADAAALQARWNALRDDDPLRNGLASIATHLFEGQSERRAAFEQGVVRAREMEHQLAALQLAAMHPRSKSDEVEVRLAFISDAERIALQPKLDSWREAVEDWSVDHETLASELLPLLRPIKDVAVDAKLRELQQSIEQPAHLNDVPGLSRWWALQKSYREQCIVRTDCAMNDDANAL